MWVWMEWGRSAAVLYALCSAMSHLMGRGPAGIEGLPIVFVHGSSIVLPVSCALSVRVLCIVLSVYLLSNRSCIVLSNHVHQLCLQ